jgi:hypothetical protein
MVDGRRRLRLGDRRMGRVAVDVGAARQQDALQGPARFRQAVQEVQRAEQVDVIEGPRVLVPHEAHGREVHDRIGL